MSFSSYEWIKANFCKRQPSFDWQWINDGFWRTIGRNPFGWNDSNDAMGNLEAFERLLNGER